jgi:hypothetical protein
LVIKTERRVMAEVNGIENVSALSKNGSASIAQTRSREGERFDFPLASSASVEFGFKFTAGGPHISRTLMLKELLSVLDLVPFGSANSIYREAVLERNILGKATDSTRHKSLRHLRELYSLDESTPIFHALRKLHTFDATSLPLLAVQVAWARDPLLRATTQPVLETSDGERVETGSLADALEMTYPNQYSLLNRNKIARNASSSWTQSGHLRGRAVKIRQPIQPTAVSVAMALLLGDTAGYHGTEVFSNPWCRLLDLSSERAKTFGFEAHRAGLINLRSLGEIVELSFPLVADCREKIL